MKKILVLVVAIATLFTGCNNYFTEDGGYLSNTVTKKSDKAMRLEAAGNDLRVYEFTPQTNSRMQCIFVTGNRKGGLFCFKKEE